MSRHTSFALPTVAFALAALLAGCSAEMLNPAATGASNVKSGSLTAANGPVGASDKIKVLPISSEDLDCPSVDIADGGATYRVGGPDNNAVRYQFDISNVARQCSPEGSQFALKIGISGQALIGPVGAPGTFSTDVKIVVMSASDKKVLYQKAYKVSADTHGGAQGPFTLVADPIMLPLTRTDLDDLFTVTVGFGNTAMVPKRRHS